MDWLLLCEGPAYVALEYIKPLQGDQLCIHLEQIDERNCIVGYSDLHNLMGFARKKMPNNIIEFFSTVLKSA